MPDSPGRYAYFPLHLSFWWSHFSVHAAMKLARSLTVVLLLAAIGATFWVFRPPPVWQPPAIPAGYPKAKADASSPVHSSSSMGARPGWRAFAAGR